MRETALLHPRLIQLLLLLWLAASCLAVVHAADHHAETAPHDCTACLVSPDLATPTSQGVHRLPPAPAALAPNTRPRAAQFTARRSHEARAPPKTA